MFGLSYFPFPQRHSGQTYEIVHVVCQELAAGNQRTGPEARFGSPEVPKVNREDAQQLIGSYLAVCHPTTSADSHPLLDFAPERFQFHQTETGECVSSSLCIALVPWSAKESPVSNFLDLRGHNTRALPTTQF